VESLEQYKYPDLGLTGK